MTYLSQRMREIRYEESVPAEVRAAHRRGETVKFMGRQITPLVAYRISNVWPWGYEGPINYRGRAG